MMSLQNHTELQMIQPLVWNGNCIHVRIYSKRSVESLEQRNVKFIKYFITCWPETLVWRVTRALVSITKGHPNSSNDLNSIWNQIKGLFGIRRTCQAFNRCIGSSNTNLP